MTEKRANPRHSPSEFQLVRDEDSQAVVGYLGDINEHGLMVLSRRPTEAGKRRRLRIQYQRRDGQFETPIFDAENVWARAPQSVGYHESGYRVIEPTLEVTNSLAEVIADLQARREE